MSVVYIQLTNGLKKISDEEYSPTKNDVVEALGYTPANPESMPDISNDDDDVLYITDKNGNVIAKIDAEKNKIRGEEVDISTPDSPIRILVIPTNEELVIARDTLAIVEGREI